MSPEPKDNVTPKGLVDGLSDAMRSLDERLRRVENQTAAMTTLGEERHSTLNNRTVGCERKFDELYNGRNSMNVRLHGLEAQIRGLQEHDDAQDNAVTSKEAVSREYKLVLLGALAGAIAAKLVALVW